MIRPSEKALGIAEDLLDYVHPGMTRAAAMQEIAQMVDEMNAELLLVTAALLDEIERTKPASHAVLATHLHHLLTDYTPWQAEPDRQHELFPPSTSTVTQAAAVAAQMP